MTDDNVIRNEILNTMNYTPFSDSASTKNMDIENGFSSSLLTFAAITTVIIMIVGISGNLLTVIALLRCPKVRNVAAAFIISLCLADLIFCAVVLPFSALRFIQGTWTQGDLLCRLIPFIQYGNIGVSLLCIAMITINRYVMIAHHSLYGKIYKKHWIGAMIAFCWIFSYGMQLPTLFGAWGTFGYDPKLGTCSIMSDEHGRSSKTSLFIAAFVIPCIIIIACYAKIFWVVHKSEVRLKQHANKQNSIPNNLRPTASQNAANKSENNMTSTIGASDSSSSMPTGGDTKREVVHQKSTRLKDQREVKAKRNEWRITKMVLAIFLSFLICYLPITIVKVADKDVEHPGLHIFSYMLLYLSACLNPIIYVIMNKQYRKAYKIILMCEPSMLLPFGKTAGGSSIPEKWKDTGLSINHSRTIVSQMSAPDQHNTSLSSLQPQTPIILEMTAQSPLDSAVMPTNANTKREQQQHQHMTIPTTTNSSNNNSSSSRVPPLIAPLSNDIQSLQSLTNAKPHHTILAGGDIIFEEEEEVKLPILLESTVPSEEAAEQATAIVEAQRKAPFYGQNINVIPDNNLKILPKRKL